MPLSDRYEETSNTETMLLTFIIMLKFLFLALQFIKIVIDMEVPLEVQILCLHPFLELTRARRSKDYKMCFLKN